MATCPACTGSLPTTTTAWWRFSDSPSPRPAASQSNPRSIAGAVMSALAAEGETVSEARPQRPRPEPLASVLVHWNCVVPPKDGVVEQVEPQAEAVAAKRDAILVHIVAGWPRKRY